MLSARFLTIAIVSVVPGLLAAAAVADTGTGSGSGGIWGGVQCPQNPYPGCQLSAGNGATVPGMGSDPTTTSDSGSGSSGSGSSKRDPFPCLDDLIPYVPATGALAPPARKSSSDGAWYISVCAGDKVNAAGGGAYYPPVWIANGANTPPRPTPAELARSAYSRLVLPEPRIVLSPAGQQLVNLPTWLAVTGGWDQRSATAAVPAVGAAPAVRVTATARPTSVVWSTGDGATVTCHGPGTVFAAGDDPSAASPTCGHTYRTSSANQLGGVYTVTATVHWSITWAGAGQGGTFAGLASTATVQVAVAESQAVSTN